MEALMEIKNQRLKHCDLLSVTGKVDSYTAPDMIKAIEAVTKEGRYKIVLDMSKLEYMSSAGFRALLVGQRVCRRYNRGEIVLAAVPKKIMEALDLNGFTTLFKVLPPIVTGNTIETLPNPAILISLIIRLMFALTLCCISTTLSSIVNVFCW
jgi:anti-sigma B factor antagonist